MVKYGFTEDETFLFHACYELLRLGSRSVEIDAVAVELRGEP